VVVTVHRHRHRHRHHRDRPTVHCGRSYGRIGPDLVGYNSAVVTGGKTQGVRVWEMAAAQDGSA
jgi:hypothetical protein